MHLVEHGAALLLLILVRILFHIAVHLIVACVGLIWRGVGWKARPSGITDVLLRHRIWHVEHLAVGRPRPILSLDLAIPYGRHVVILAIRPLLDRLI